MEQKNKYRRYSADVKVPVDFDLPVDVEGMDPEKVDLSVEEKDRVTAEFLKAALRRKKSLVKTIQYKQKILAEPQVRKYSAAEYLKRIKALGKTLFDGFVIDKDNEQIFKALSLYFSEDPDFEQLDESFSLNKGLFVGGDVGTGKTVMMRLFQVNQRASYRIVSCRDVAYDFISSKKDQSGGVEVIKSYSQPSMDGPVEAMTKFRQSQFGTCFDDLGTEVIGKHFGNELNVMQEIIQGRYMSSMPFYMTHLTTNLNADQIVERYGGKRIRSRFREMFNVIDFPSSAKDRRA